MLPGSRCSALSNLHGGLVMHQLSLQQHAHIPRASPRWQHIYSFASHSSPANAACSRTIRHIPNSVSRVDSVQCRSADSSVAACSPSDDSFREQQQQHRTAAGDSPSGLSAHIARAAVLQRLWHFRWLKAPPGVPDMRYCRSQGPFIRYAADRKVKMHVRRGAGP